MKTPLEGMFVVLLLQQLFTTLPVRTSNVPNQWRGNRVKQTTTRGREFLFSFLRLYKENVKLRLYLTAQDADWTKITVNVPAFEHIVKSSVERGEVRKIYMPYDMEPLSDDLHNNTVIITADHDISVYAFMYSGLSAGGFMVLPVHALGYEYFVASYQPAIDEYEEWSQFAITATEDETEVMIQFRAIVEFMGKTYRPGDRIEKILNRFDNILIKSQEDLTGSYIKSSKPISVVSGVSGARLPEDMQTIDHMVTHLVPVNRWGTTFTIPPVPGRRSGYKFRVIASCPLTSVNMVAKNTQIPMLMKSGDYYECDVEKATVLITSIKPIMVVQYAKSQAYREGSKPRDDGDGDALMLVIPPFESYLANNITFPGITLIGSQPFRTKASITALCKDFSNIKLNNELIFGNQVTFDNICTKQAALDPLLNSFTIASDKASSRFIILVYGAASEISYAYTAGFALHESNCDGQLTNDASFTRTCCLEEATSSSYFISASQSSYETSQEETESDYAGSSESASVEPSKPDMKFSAVPLNDTPGPESERKDEKDIPTLRSEDPAFSRDQSGRDGAMCLMSVFVQMQILTVSIIAVMLFR